MRGARRYNDLSHGQCKMTVRGVRRVNGTGDDSAAAARARRAYRSELRQMQARATRAKIRDEAGRLFLDRGYTATTVADIARAAGVSSQTVYNAYGSKAALLKSVYDVTLVGDDEPVPLAGRPEMVAVLTATDGRALLAAYARVGMLLMLRLGRVIAMVEQGAAAGDPDLIELVETTGRERRIGSGRIVERLVALGGLRPGLSVTKAQDLVWTLTDVRLWRLLVERCGWLPEEYADYLAEGMANAVLPRPGQTAAGGVEPGAP